MAANDYYNSHPQNSTHSYSPIQYYSNVPPDYPTSSTSYEPYRQSGIAHSHPQYPYSLSGSDTSSQPSSSPPEQRGFLTPSAPPGLKKSKSDRAIKFVEKQVKKQIDKKLHGGRRKHNQEHAQEHVIEASQQDSSGNQGGQYGYGDTSGGYGPAADSGSSGSGGKFDFGGSGEGSSGWWESLTGGDGDGGSGWESLLG